MVPERKNGNGKYGIIAVMVTIVLSLIGIAYHAGTLAQRLTAEEAATIRATMVLEKLVDKVDVMSAELVRQGRDKS